MANILRFEDLLSSSGWETRKKIIEELKTGEKSINDIAKKLGVNYSTVRYHLELMERFGLVKQKKTRMRKYYYELTKDAYKLSL